jgi:hypothetical protein
MTIEQDPDRTAAANHYQSYMRGWKNGACVNAIDTTFIARETSDPIRQHYEMGYAGGRKARNNAANIATNLTSHAPSVLRMADGKEPRHLFFDGNRGEAWAKFHHVVSEPESLAGGHILIIAEPHLGPGDAIRSAPEGVQDPTYQPGAGTLTWPNGVVAHVVSVRSLRHTRGRNIAFAFVADWPSEDDWRAYVEPVVRLGRAQIVAIDQPPASWSQRPGFES